MDLKIKASRLCTRHTLEVHSKGVTFCETAGLGSGVRKFGFAQIDFILMSPADVLTFQVGREIFSIPVKPTNKIHQRVIGALLEEVGRNGSPSSLRGS